MRRLRQCAARAAASASTTPGEKISTDGELATTRRWRRVAFLFATICALFALFGFAGNAAAVVRSGGTGTDPWISSDLPDYPPGATVNLLGGSWQPGEAVHIVVNDDAGQTWRRVSDVTADGSGDITDTFTLPDWFVANYSMTASVGNFDFHASLYQWLVVSGFKSQYKGTGTVNGSGSYDFTLTAYDGDLMNPALPDKFRIRITDNNNSNAVVFDNKYGTPTDIDSADPQVIAGGSIVIHKA